MLVPPHKFFGFLDQKFACALVHLCCLFRLGGEVRAVDPAVWSDLVMYLPWSVIYPCYLSHKNLAATVSVSCKATPLLGVPTPGAYQVTPRRCSIVTSLPAAGAG